MHHLQRIVQGDRGIVIYAHPRVSPDVRLLAVSRSDAGSPDIWIYELSGGAEMQRLTFGGRSRFPIWSADSRRVTYQSMQDRESGGRRLTAVRQNVSRLRSRTKNMRPKRGRQTDRGCSSPSEKGR